MTGAGEQAGGADALLQQEGYSGHDIEPTQLLMTALMHVRGDCIVAGGLGGTYVAEVALENQEINSQEQ